MDSSVTRALRLRLTEAGLRKLPPPVIEEVERQVLADIEVASHKSIARRTAPKAIARLFASWVMHGRPQGLQGGETSLDQWGEPTPLIGPDALTGGVTSVEEAAQ